MMPKNLVKAMAVAGALVVGGYLHLKRPEPSQMMVSASTQMLAPELFLEEAALPAVLPLKIILTVNTATVSNPISEQPQPAEEGHNITGDSQYDYSNPRIQHFYDLFTGERSRDIQTRIERTRQYDSMIRAAAEEHSIPYHTLFALIVNESGGHPEAVSSAGARGLTQIMPRTAAGYSCGNLADPERSIKCGARILADYTRWLGNLDLGLAAYAIGPGSVRDRMEAAGTDAYLELFSEGEYVPKIRAVELIIESFE